MDPSPHATSIAPRRKATTPGPGKARSDIELRHYLRVLRRRRALVVVIVLVAIFSGFLITPRDSSYTAKAQLYVGSRDIDINRATGNVSGDLSLGLTYLANSFARIIELRTVAESALVDSGVDRTLDEVQSSIKATATPGTQLVTVSVTDRDPTVASSLANAAADSLVTLVRDQERQQSSSSTASTAPVSVLEHSAPPTNPEPSGLFRNLILATLFGLAVAIGLVVLLEYLDLTVKSADDAQRRLQLRVLGAIPFDAGSLGS